MRVLELLWSDMRFGLSLSASFRGEGAQSALMLPTFVPVLSIDAFARYYRVMVLHRTESEENAHSAVPDYYSSCLGWRERAEAVSRYYNALPAEERQKTAIFANFYGQAGAIDHFGSRTGIAQGDLHSPLLLVLGKQRLHRRKRHRPQRRPRGQVQRHCASVTLAADPKAQWARPDWERPISTQACFF